MKCVVNMPITDLKSEDIRQKNMYNVLGLVVDFEISNLSQKTLTHTKSLVNPIPQFL